MHFQVIFPTTVGYKALQESPKKAHKALRKGSIIEIREKVPSRLILEDQVKVGRGFPTLIFFMKTTFSFLPGFLDSSCDCATSLMCYP